MLITYSSAFYTLIIFSNLLHVYELYNIYYKKILVYKEQNHHYLDNQLFLNKHHIFYLQN